jgi:hypothetical protein
MFRAIPAFNGVNRQPFAMPTPEIRGLKRYPKLPKLAA